MEGFFAEFGDEAKPTHGLDVGYKVKRNLILDTHTHTHAHNKHTHRHTHTLYKVSSLSLLSFMYLLVIKSISLETTLTLDFFAQTGLCITLNY